MTLDPNRQPDVEAEVTFLGEAEGGRARPAISGYRPAHSVLDDYLTSGVILPTTDGHPVKRVHYATEVNHDKKDIDNERRQSQNTQTAFAGVS